MASKRKRMSTAPVPRLFPLFPLVNSSFGNNENSAIARKCAWAVRSRYKKSFTVFLCSWCGDGLLQACRIPTQCMSTSLAKRFPLPSYTRQCATCTCTHSLALEYTVPLNVYRKDSRHCTSCLKSADSLALCRCCWRGCRVSSMRRRKTQYLFTHSSEKECFISYSWNHTGSWSKVSTNNNELVLVEPVWQNRV